MNLNEECLLHYLGHFKNRLQPPKPAPALQPAMDLSQQRKAQTERARELRMRR